MAGRFNIFQRTMLFWDELHPYNALQIARVPSVLEPDRLRRMLGCVLEERGLTGLVIDSRARAFEYRGGPAAVELRLASASGDPAAALGDEIEWQINTRFDHSAAFTPFRFFAIPDGATFWLGVVYFHAVADGAAVMRLVLEIISDYSGTSAPVRRDKLDLHGKTPARWRPGLWLRKLLALPSEIRAQRSSIRPGSWHGDGFTNGVAVFTLGRRELETLTASGKTLAVTFNDLFLALLMRALSPLAAARRDGRRSRMSLGCIVNARRDMGLDDPTFFGMAFGSFTVTHSSPEAGSLADLAREVSRQTRRLKRGGLYLANSLEMRLALMMMTFSSTEQRRRFYPKNWPLWGGVSNVNLSNFREPLPPGSPADYFRTVSTGPATPLVLGVTTFGDHVNVVMTYRKAVFSAAEISAVRERFVTAIGELRASA